MNDYSSLDKVKFHSLRRQTAQARWHTQRLLGAHTGDEAAATKPVRASQLGLQCGTGRSIISPSHSGLHCASGCFLYIRYKGLRRLVEQCVTGRAMCFLITLISSIKLAWNITDTRLLTIFLLFPRLFGRQNRSHVNPLLWEAYGTCSLSTVEEKYLVELMLSWSERSKWPRIFFRPTRLTV